MTHEAMTEKPLHIDWASHDAAKYACENWHYSKCLPVGKLVKVGAWEYGKFVGVVLFGRGANKSLGTPYGLDQSNVCELVRIALTNHTSPVSRIMTIATKLLAKSQPSLRLVVSFADKEQQHHGGIYQAANWIYTGETTPADEYIYKGKRWHGRAFRKSHGSHTQYINKGLQIVSGSSKHRYLMPLDKAMHAQIQSLARPYPKRAASIDSDAVNIQLTEGGAIPTVALNTAEVQHG